MIGRLLLPEGADPRALPMLVGRALRAFADHDDATQHALDAIAGVEGDDDLEARGLTGDRSPRPTKTPRSRCRHPHLTGTTAACG